MYGELAWTDEELHGRVSYDFRHFAPARPLEPAIRVDPGKPHVPRWRDVLGGVRELVAPMATFTAVIASAVMALTLVADVLR